MATFPQAPLPVSVHIAPGANPADPSSMQFTEVTSDVRYEEAIQIQAGRQDQGSRVDATAQQITFDDRSGNYSRRNPLGTWYGQLRSGTPVQTRVQLINDQFDRVVASGLGTDADSGRVWTADGFCSVDGANANVTLAAGFFSLPFLNGVRADDVDLVKVASLNQVATGGAWVDATVVRYSDSSNYYRLHTEFGTGGIISVKITRLAGGVSTDLYTTTATSVSYSAGTKISSRIQAIGPTFRIKVWLTSGSEPAAWTASVTDSSTTARTAIVGLYEWRVPGNTNSNPLTMTMYSYRCDVIRATTPVPEWSPRWDQSSKDATTPIAGAGILRRLSQGQSALRSPLYRGLSAQNPSGFWPLEDDAGATQASSALPAGTPGPVTDVTFAGSGPPGASSAVTTNNFTSTISGTCTGPDTPNGYACLILVKFASLPGSLAPIVQWTATGTVGTWTVFGDSTGISITGLDRTGASVVAPAATTYVIDPTKWWALQLETNVSGGTVSWSLLWTQVGTGVFYAQTGTYSGTAPKATGFKCLGQANVSYSMSWLGDNDLSFVSTSFSALASGFSGETAGNRMIRLAAEEDVPIIVMGDPNLTAPMGTQTAQTFIDLVRECEAADQGLLVERGVGLGYLTRVFRFNVPVTMSLDFASGHVAAPPEPTDDDLNLINVVKLTRTGGSEVTVQDNTSVALSGAYTDETTVNLYADSQLADQAGWRLHLGTLDELRWPVITLDLARNPNLIPAWASLRIGARLTVANPPSAVAGASLDLVVEGYTETISLYSWDVQINCSPATAWDVGIYDTSRYDSQTSTLAAPLTTSTTSWSTTAAVLSDCWDQVAVPYDVLVGGERCTVTFASAPSGTGPYTQTLTCTRSVNGIVKAHSTNESIKIATPGRYAL